MTNRSIASIVLGALALVSGLTLVAQTVETRQDVRIVNAAPGVPDKGITMAYRTQSMMMDAAPVKGSPFCATVANDHTQMFADGNRIHTTESSLLCRDSQGRTRREAQLNLLGAVPQGAVPKLITIENPVAGVRYTLDTFSKVARKMSMAPGLVGTVDSPKGGVHTVEGGDAVFLTNPAGAGGPPPLAAGGRVMIRNEGLAGSTDDVKTDNLGDQTIEGIHATGTRVTTIIPAGKMGNEQPISIVSEHWYSPELKATVMTKHTDPWAGTLTTQFTNVSTSEPDPSLFTVPSDYKVVEGGDPFTIKIQKPAPPTE